MRNDLSDEKIVSGFNKNDPYLFWQVYKKCHRGLYDIARKILRNEDDAKDMVSNVFEKMWKKEDKDFITMNGIMSFLHASTRNECISLLREKERQEKKHKAFGWIADMTVPGSDGELIKAAAKEMLYAEIEKLPPRRRKVIKLRYLEEMSEEEVAATLGVSRHTVRNQEQKALKKFKETLSPHKRKLLSVLIIIIGP